MDVVNQNNNNRKLSKVLSTKLSIEDYNAFVILTKLEYEAGLIKEESTSELLRFTIRHILSQAHNQPEYLILKQRQQKAQDNQHQQQLHINIVYNLAILLLEFSSIKFLTQLRKRIQFLRRLYRRHHYHHYYHQHK
jgi:hypothetical protein